MTDITPILEVIIRLVALIITIVIIPKVKKLLPKVKKLLAEKIAESDQKKILRWGEIAAQAAEEAARSGLIDKKAKYNYAKSFLEDRGITFDADTMEALINSTVWDLFNRFKDESEE